MKKQALAVLAAILSISLSVSSCLTTNLDLICPGADEIRVCFYIQQNGSVDASDTADKSDTKTSIAPNGISTHWTPTDKVALWARRISDGAEVVSGTIFSLAGKSGSKAEFSATLVSPMPEGRYMYCACYPYPTSISGKTLTFTLPAEQDGSASDAILMSANTEGGALTDGKATSESLCLQMEHLSHVLRFYLPDEEDPFEGEPVRSIRLDFSRNVVGQVHTSIPYSASQTTLEGGSSSVTLNLASPLTKGGFACAAIHPTSFNSGETLSITVSTDSWEGVSNPISLSGRNFQAGHCTPVPIFIKEKKASYSIDFILKDNNLGEPLQRIKIGDYTYSIGSDIPTGSVIKLRYDTQEEFRSQGNTDKTVTFESEHVIATKAVRIPDLSTVSNVKIDISAPWLLEENFDCATSFSSYDAHSTSNVGSKDAVSFLNGWTGGRIGAQEGKCIRIAGHRESGMWIDVHYPARVESACLPTIKSAVEIELTFDYGTDCDGIDKYGQNVYIGYVTETKAYKSGDTTGTYPESFSSSLQDGSYDSTPNSASYTLSIPAGNSIRISWRNDPQEHSDFASNTTSWLYIDNVKVKIKK